MEKQVNKTVNLSLVGVNGNAFMVLGVFARQARKEGWTESEINQVLDQARSGDYSHLLATIDSYCEPKNTDQQ